MGSKLLGYSSANLTWSSSEDKNSENVNFLLGAQTQEEFDKLVKMENFQMAMSEGTA